MWPRHPAKTQAAPPTGARMPPAPGNLEPHRFGRRLRFQARWEAQPLSRHGKKVTRAMQDQRAHGSWKRALRPRLQKSTAHGSNQCYMSDLALITILNRDHIVSHEDFMPVQFMHVSLLVSIYPNMDTCTGYVSLSVLSLASPSWKSRMLFIYSNLTHIEKEDM